jgi:hypothetical protein
LVCIIKAEIPLSRKNVGHFVPINLPIILRSLPFGYKGGAPAPVICMCSVEIAENFELPKDLLKIDSCAIFMTYSSVLTQSCC